MQENQNYFMEYISLLAGIALCSVFGWILVKTRHRSEKGFWYDWIRRFDVLVGIVAGLYLIITSLF